MYSTDSSKRLCQNRSPAQVSADKLDGIVRVLGSTVIEIIAPKTAVDADGLKPFIEATFELWKTTNPTRYEPSWEECPMVRLSDALRVALPKCVCVCKVNIHIGVAARAWLISL